MEFSLENLWFKLYILYSYSYMSLKFWTVQFLIAIQFIIGNQNLKFKYCFILTIIFPTDNIPKIWIHYINNVYTLIKL